MLKLYDKTGETLIGNLDEFISCEVTEVRNGIFDAKIVYPAMRSISNELIRENIVVCKANDKLLNQKFRIFNVRKKYSNTIEVLARHKSFDLLYDFIEEISIVNQSCEYALNTIFRNSQFSRHYKGYSDIINAQDYNMSMTNCLNAIAGKQGSIIDTYGTGAEILRDNENIHVLNRRGHDNNVVIEYGKNLEGFECTEDTTDLITRIYPFVKKATAEGDVTITLNEKFVDSPRINLYSHPYIKEIDLTSKFSEGEEITQAKIKLEAEKYFIETKCDIPKLTFNIKFIPLSKCVGFENLDERISLCDVVTIKHKIYGITTQAKVIKTVFDVGTDRYKSMQLGDPKASLGDLIGNGDTPQVGPPGPQGPPGQDGSIGDFPDSLPAIPQLSVTVLGFASVDLSWTYENKVYYNYQVFASKTENFNPNMFDLIFEGQASSFLHQVKPNETWYYRARAVNTHGKATELSTQVKVTTKTADDFDNYFSNVAIEKLVAGIFSVDYMTAGIIKGNWIDAKDLSVTDGNGKRTLDIDSDGNVNLDVKTFKIRSQNVSTENETADRIKNAIDTYKITVDKTFTQVNNAHDDLVRIMEGSFKDGIIDEVETIAIKEKLRALELEITEIQKTYSTIYSSNELLSEFKVVLEQKHIDYTAKYSELKIAIESSIGDNLITVEENSLITEKIKAYNLSYADIKNQFNISLEAISKNRIDSLGNTVNDRFTNVEKEAGKIKETVGQHTNDLATIDGEVKKKLTKLEFTEFEQNYNNFKFNVTTKYGFENIIKNSGFLYGYTHFNIMQNDFDGTGEVHITPDNDPWVLSGTCAANIRGGNFTTGTYGLRQEGFKLKPNTTYTLALTASAHRCQWRASITTKGWGQPAYLEGSKEGGKDPNNWDEISYTFTTGPSNDDLSYCRLDLLVQNPNGHNAQAWFTNIRLVEGDYAPKWSPKSGETYSNTVILDDSNFRLAFENGQYAQMGRKGLELLIGNREYPYHALMHVIAVNIPAGNPGIANVRLPDEFDDKPIESIKWSAAQRGYYYTSSYAFFPFYVQVEGRNLYKHTDGHYYVEVAGYARIQNAENPSDIQNMPKGVNAMISVIA